jgi:histidinol dehydrogenase
MRSAAIASVVFAAFLALVAGSARAVTTTPVNCGDTITKNIVVGNDLTDCGAYGLIIGADKVAINLNGQHDRRR